VFVTQVQTFCQKVFKVIVYVKEQLVTSQTMSRLALHSSRLERVSAVARTVTGLVSVKVVKVIQVLPVLLSDVGRLVSCNKYERYYGPRRCLLAYLLYCMPMVSPACA